MPLTCKILARSVSYHAPDRNLTFSWDRPIHSFNSKRAKWWGQALFRSYGCFFAEFLGDHSLVRLRLLDEITCVGLRYGFRIDNLRSFSRKRALILSALLPYPRRLNTLFKGGSGFARTHSYGMSTNPIRCVPYCTPSLHRSIRKSRNINRVSIGCGVRHPLRTD